VESGQTRLLIDAGFSGIELERRLRTLGRSPEQISGVVVTHEHHDHTAGIGVAARRWGWPLYMTVETAAACSSLLHGSETIRPYLGAVPFRVGSLEVQPFFTCHDATDPLAVTVTAPAAAFKVGIATDLGRPTTPVRRALRGCDFLILEANHDESLLRDGPYPWSVKQRIGGSRGHLSNRMAAELAAELLHPGLVGILLAHLSRECNDAARARGAIGHRLAGTGFRGALEVAAQDAPSRLYDLANLRRRALDGIQTSLALDTPAASDWNTAVR